MTRPEDVRVLMDPEGDALTSLRQALPEGYASKNAMYGSHQALHVWRPAAAGVLGEESGVDVLHPGRSFCYAVDGGAPRSLGPDVTGALAQLAVVLPVDDAGRTRAALSALAGELPSYLEATNTDDGRLKVRNRRVAEVGSLIVAFTPDANRGGVFCAQWDDDLEDECEPALEFPEPPVSIGADVGTAAAKVARILAANPVTTMTP